MVSCQWRLTTGPRAGQACGKGTKVFCGSHEPKALEAVRRIDYYGNRSTAKYLEEYFALDIDNIRYYRRKENDWVDFSASWIWQGDELNTRVTNTNSKINAIQFITNPEVVSTWLEEQLSNATIRNGQIFPVPVTESQRRAISKLQYIFEQRKTMSQNFSSSYVPLPFFQNNGVKQGGYYRNATQRKQQLFNRGFTTFLQECVAYTPDYAAVWGWFYPRFNREIARILDAYKGQNYDMDAISEDLKQLLRAYSLDLASRPDSNGYSNRYRR
mgnify:CR=1 FL=1